MVFRPSEEDAVPYTRAQHRATVRTSVSGIVLALAVAGSATGGRWLLSGQDSPTAPARLAGAPAPTSPSPRAATSTPGTPAPRASSAGTPQRPERTQARQPDPAPVSPEPTRSAATIPTSVPSRIFLQPADRNDRDAAKDGSSDDALPSLCGTRLGAGHRVGVRRTKNSTFRNEGTSLDNVPDGYLHQTITVHRGDGAAEFMSALRAAVVDCPAQIVEGGRHEYTLLDADQLGDESIMVQERYAEPEAVDATETVFRTGRISAVRVDDAVTVITAQGWEGTDVDPATMAALTGAAHRRLDGWR